jgi:lipoprotein-anchoring transpeptidase ErfK/SrfK
MFGKLALAAVFGAVVAVATPAQAQQNFLEALVQGIQEAFAGGIDPRAGAYRQPQSAPGQQASLLQGRALYPEDVPRSRVVPSQFRRQIVRYPSDERPGTIIIDTRAHFLYYVLDEDRAVRYGVGVGRTGFGWKGVVRVANKQEWPAWRPPQEMIAREARRGHRLPAYMEGGPGNPLGARALYLHNQGGDTGYRIHGTSEPWTIGLNVSSGCIRLVNDDVIDLYKRTGMGTKVVVL